MAYDEKLANAWRGELATLDGVSEKKMMGGLWFLLNGNMLGTTRDDYFMFRVGKDNEAEALKRKGASRMQMGDKKMYGFINVPAAQCSASEFKSWVELVVEFVSTLPPK